MQVPGMCSLPKAFEELLLFAYENWDMLFTLLISAHLKPGFGGVDSHAACTICELYLRTVSQRYMCVR